MCKACNGNLEQETYRGVAEHDHDLDTEPRYRLATLVADLDDAISDKHSESRANTSDHCGCNAVFYYREMLTYEIRAIGECCIPDEIKS